MWAFLALFPNTNCMSWVYSRVEPWKSRCLVNCCPTLSSWTVFAPLLFAQYRTILFLHQPCLPLVFSQEVTSWQRAKQIFTSWNNIFSASNILTHKTLPNENSCEIMRDCKRGNFQSFEKRRNRWSHILYVERSELPMEGVKNILAPNLLSPSPGWVVAWQQSFTTIAHILDFFVSWTIHIHLQGNISAFNNHCNCTMNFSPAWHCKEAAADKGGSTWKIFGLGCRETTMRPVSNM